MLSLSKILLSSLRKPWLSYQRRFGSKFGVLLILEHCKSHALWCAKIGLKESEEVHTILSSEMVLNNCQKSLEDINLVLSHWEMLRIVRMSSEISNAELCTSFGHTPILGEDDFPKGV
jgi:hypothetical protein